MTFRSIGKSEEEEVGPVFEPRVDVPRQSAIGLVVDYSSARVYATLGLTAEASSGEDAGILDTYSGLTPLAGASYRLTPGFALGFSFWGPGSPPWSGESRIREMDRNTQGVGVVLTFGGPAGTSSDLMISTPFGAAGESARIHFRTRAFR